jgi:hypothetical protein
MLGPCQGFIKDLSSLGQHDYNSHRFRGYESPWENCVYYFDAEEFVAKEVVKLLVRQDNEVKQFTDEEHYDVQNDSDYRTGE